MKRVTTKLSQRYRYATILLKELVKTDFKIRYQNSFLGYIWSLLKPLFLFLILYVVFVDFLHVDYGVKHSALYLLLGIVTWSFFSEATGTSVSAIVSKGDLLRKLNFPRYVIVLATTSSSIINLCLNLIVVVIFMIGSRFVPGSDILIAPLLFLELILFALALGFFLSAVYVKLRDVTYLWDVCLQALFYLTPIFYAVKVVPLRLQKVLILNPLAQVIQDLRYVVISHDTRTISDIYGTPWARLIPIGLTVVF